MRPGEGHDLPRSHSKAVAVPRSPEGTHTQCPAFSKCPPLASSCYSLLTETHSERETYTGPKSQRAREELTSSFFSVSTNVSSSKKLVPTTRVNVTPHPHAPNYAASPPLFLSWCHCCSHSLPPVGVYLLTCFLCAQPPPYLSYKQAGSLYH